MCRQTLSSSKSRRAPQLEALETRPAAAAQPGRRASQVPSFISTLTKLGALTRQHTQHWGTHSFRTQAALMQSYLSKRRAAVPPLHAERALVCVCGADVQDKVCVSQPRCFHSVPPAGLIDEPHTHTHLTPNPNTHRVI